MSRKIDMTGQQFGYWTVLSYDENSKGGTAKWICKCVCGTEKSIAGPTLRKGTSTNCGCIKAAKSRENNGKFINEIGNRYGKLVVIAKAEQESVENHRAYWLCQCDCGNTKIVSSKCLRDGKTKSCGCVLSRGEEEITRLLLRYNIPFKSQYSVIIKDILYRFDFVLYDDKGNPKALIEYHGIQHYDTTHQHWGKDVSVNQQRDQIKAQWALDNNLPLYTIPYTDFEILEEKIKEIIIKTKE